LTYLLKRYDLENPNYMGFNIAVNYAKLRLYNKCLSQNVAQEVDIWRDYIRAGTPPIK